MINQPRILVIRRDNIGGLAGLGLPVVALFEKLPYKKRDIAGRLQ